jgi:hypothetical protein
MGSPVMLNVYDLAPANDWTYWCGVGVYHTGVQVRAAQRGGRCGWDGDWWGGAAADGWRGTLGWAARRGRQQTWQLPACGGPCGPLLDSQAIPLHAVPSPLPISIQPLPPLPSPLPPPPPAPGPGLRRRVRVRRCAARGGGAAARPQGAPRAHGARSTQRRVRLARSPSPAPRLSHPASPLGHDYDVSGVFATNPREAPGAVTFREGIYMGDTDLTPGQVQALVQSMGQQYKGNAYHLLQTNCNHFASDLCVQLVGRPPPPWINRLAGLAVMLHCLLPPTWVPPLQTPSMAPDELEPQGGRLWGGRGGGGELRRRCGRCTPGASGPSLHSSVRAPPFASLCAGSPHPHPQSSCRVGPTLRRASPRTRPRARRCSPRARRRRTLTLSRRAPSPPAGGSERPAGPRPAAVSPAPDCQQPPAVQLTPNQYKQPARRWLPARRHRNDCCSQRPGRPLCPPRFARSPTHPSAAPPPRGTARRGAARRGAAAPSRAAWARTAAPTAPRGTLQVFSSDAFPPIRVPSAAKRQTAAAASADCRPYVGGPAAPRRAPAPPPPLPGAPLCLVRSARPT